jgi:hypothetical protein
MVGASDVDSSSAYSTSSSSSSEDEGDRRKGRKSSKNLSGLSCFVRDGFCTMVLSSGSKKSTQSDSDSDDVTNRVFGEENPTPCTIVIVPRLVSYHVQNSLQNNIISIQRNQSTNHNIYIQNNSVYEFSTSPLGYATSKHPA